MKIVQRYLAHWPQDGGHSRRGRRERHVVPVRKYPLLISKGSQHLSANDRRRARNLRSKYFPLKFWSILCSIWAVIGTSTHSPNEIPSISDRRLPQKSLFDLQCSEPHSLTIVSIRLSKQLAITLFEFLRTYGCFALLMVETAKDGKSALRSKLNDSVLLPLREIFCKGWIFATYASLTWPKTAIVNSPSLVGTFAPISCTQKAWALDSAL